MGQRARNLYFLFELTVERRLPEYHTDGIRNRKIQVGTTASVFKGPSQCRTCSKLNSPQKLTPNSKEILVQWSVVFRAGTLPTAGPLVEAEMN